MDNGYFWMDTLCVDQSSVDARISVIPHIPDIFRRAQNTIVVRDGGGICTCCTAAILGMGTLKDVSDIGQRMADHFSATHEMDNSFNEGVLDRLWPLQEILLSDEVNFVVLDEVPIVKVTGYKLSWRVQLAET